MNAENFLAVGMAVFALSTIVLLIRSGRAANQLSKIAERAKQERTLLSDSPMSWLILRDGLILEHSNNLEQDFGLETNPVREIDDLGLIPEDKRVPSLAAALGDAWRGGSGTFLAHTADHGQIFEVWRPQAIDDGSAIVWLREITATSVLEKDLKEVQSNSEAIFAALDRVDVPLWRRDAEMRLDWVNNAYVQAVEAHSTAQVISNQIELSISSLARPIKEMAEEAVEQGTRLRERHFVVVEESRRAVDIAQSPLPNRGAIGAMIDVTEAEDAKSDLARHIESHAETLNRLNTPVAVYGPDKSLQLFNSAFAEMTQLSASWLMSKPQHGLVLESMREKNRLPEQPDFPKWKAGILALYTEPFESNEALWSLLDGSTWRVLSQPHPLGGIIEFYEDVTDRLALEQSFNTLSAVQQETLDHLHQAVVVFGSDGRVKLFNDPYTEMLGLERESLAREPHFTEFAQMTSDRENGEETLQVMTDTAQSHLDTHEAVSGTLEFSDDRTFNYRWVPLPDGAMLCSFDDVTDALRIERAMRQRSEALEVNDRLKSEIIARVSHEVRAPLNTVMGFAEILASELVVPLDTQQKPYVDGIVVSAGELAGLLDDMLEFVSDESEEIILEIAPINVAPMLEDVGNFFESQAHARGYRIDVNCTDGLDIVQADERRIKQALFTLLSNAINAPFEEDRIELAAYAAGGSLHLSVATSNSKRLAEAEDRMPRPTVATELRADTGDKSLGMSIVQRIVAAHGGRIVLEERGDGSRGITCILPLDL